MSDMDVKNSHSLRAIRPLGCMERYQAALHSLNMYIGAAVTCHYVPPTRNDLAANSSDHLRRFFDIAICRTVLQHPNLQVGIAEDGSREPLWIQLNEIDLDSLVQWHTIPEEHNFSSVEIVKREINTKFANLAACPGWRITILHHLESRTLEVVFAFHHAVGDGITGKLFHSALLQHLHEAQGLEDEPRLLGRVLTLPHTIHFPPPLEKMCKFPISTSYMASHLWDGLRAWIPFLGPKSGTTRWAPIIIQPYETEIRRFQVDHVQVEAILKACRKHETTLTGLIHGIMLVSLASRIEMGRADTFLSRTPIDLRPVVPPFTSDGIQFEPQRMMGNIVSLINHQFDHSLIDRIRHLAVNNASDSVLVPEVWRIARTVRKEIQVARDRGVKDNIIGLMEYISDWREHQSKLLKLPRQYAWGITNLGVMEGNGNGAGWTIGEAAFSVCSQVDGPAVKICILTVKGKALCVDFVWQRGIVETTFAEQVVASLKHRLTRTNLDE